MAGVDLYVVVSVGVPARDKTSRVDLAATEVQSWYGLFLTEAGQKLVIEFVSLSVRVVTVC